MAFLARFEEFEVVSLDDDFVRRALVLLPRFSLRTADAVLAVTALLTGAVLVSWDRRLLRAASARVTALTPAEFIARQRS